MKKIDENLFDRIKEFYPEVANFIEENQGKNTLPITRYISKTKRYNVLKNQNWCCNQCGCRLKYYKSTGIIAEVAHIDHIHPFSKKDTYVNGDTNINEIENLQALCPKCNLSKNNKEIH